MIAELTFIGTFILCALCIYMLSFIWIGMSAVLFTSLCSALYIYHEKFEYYVVLIVIVILSIMRIKKEEIKYDI